MGNHDRMFSMFMEDYPRNDARLLIGLHWFHDRVGGVETMASYGVEVHETDRIYAIHAKALAQVPKSHRAFLSELKYSHREGDLFFAHAGIRPGIALGDQTDDDLIWIRNEFLDSKSEHPCLIVHGHTQVPEARHYGNRVNIDSGAASGGPVTAVAFEGRNCWKLTSDGRIPLLPPS